MKKRVLTLLLAGIMAVSTTGVSSFAAETETETATEATSAADEEYGEVVIEDGDRPLPVQRRGFDETGLKRLHRCNQ